jgi:anthranilate phosphoribosyltransferase
MLCSPAPRLGAATPLETLEDVASSLEVDLVVLSTVDPQWVAHHAAELRRIGAGRRIAVGGAGAEALPGTADDVLALTDDPVREAQRVAALVRAAERG